MSKPDKPGELRDVDVVSVSLVSRAANKHTFAIYKSQKEDTHVREPTKDGFFEMCRKFFLGDPAAENAEKGAVKDNMDRNIKAQQLSAALDGLHSALFYGDDSAVRKGDWAAAKEAASEFAEIVAAIADGSDVLKAEAAAELEKAGKKICGARMKKLMDIRAVLDEIIAEGDDTDIVEKGEIENMTREEVSEILKGELAPITERLAKLEAAEEAAKKNAEPQPETLTAEDVTKAVAEAVQPLAGRIEALEKARGMSNRLPDEGEDAKKAAGGFWGGTILG